MNMNLSKLWEIQGSQRLGLNTTFLFCSPLTLRRSCFSLNFCPCLPATFRTYSLSCCRLFASSSPILFIVFGSSSGFFQFSICLEVDVFASHAPHPHHLREWRLNKKHSSCKSQIPAGGIWDGRTRGVKWLAQNTHPDTGSGERSFWRQGPRRYGGWEGVGIRSGSQEWGAILRIPGPGRACGLQGPRLRTAERKYSPRVREFYAVQEVQRGP